ncbi:MAG: glycosyltransferase family 4 protein [Acidobacteriota bacterium]|nr:glycosyltransferase family 4 protein [Acidobacteriota bacterium]
MAELKILLYTHGFPPILGGVETYAALFADGLTSFSRSATGPTFVVTVVTRTAAGDFDDSKLTFRVVRRPDFWELVRLIREADLVHLAGPCLLPLAVCWLIRKPVLIVHHGYQTICPNGLLFKQPSQTMCVGHFMKGEYVECLHCCKQTTGPVRSVQSLILTFPRRWLCKRIAANVCITKYVESRISLPRSRTVYYGIDVSEPIDAQWARRQSVALEFGYVGRLVSEKGLKLILRAAKQILDRGKMFKLTFVGDGPDRQSLESMVQELGLGEIVKFTGSLRNAELYRAVRDVSVLMMPSIWEETAGLSAIEQMMRGRLVIAADVGGLGEVVGDAGLKFAPGDWRGLASCMQRVIDSPEIVELLGATARARAVELFPKHQMIEHQLEVYREVLHV